MSVSAALRTLLWSESVCPDGSADVPADHYSAHPSLIARLESDWEEFTDRLPADFEPENQWQGMSPEPEWDAGSIGPRLDLDPQSPWRRILGW